MSCTHPDTFDCHGHPRCTACLCDARTATDGTLVWPSQDHPHQFDADRIVEWFFKHRRVLPGQHVDTLEFCRNNMSADRTYGYVWVLVCVDVDYEAFYVLDVRTHDGREETRRLLYVASTPHGVEHCWVDSAVASRGADCSRIADATRFVADRLAERAATHSGEVSSTG